MTFKNDSDAYSVKATYGNIDEQVRAASQKYTAQHYATALQQTRMYIEKLPPGEYRFQYPTVLADIVKDADNLEFVGFDPKYQIVTVKKS